MKHLKFSHCRQINFRLAFWESSDILAQKSFSQISKTSSLTSASVVWIPSKISLRNFTYPFGKWQNKLMGKSTSPRILPRQDFLCTLQLKHWVFWFFLVQKLMYRWNYKPGVSYTMDLLVWSFGCVFFFIENIFSPHWNNTNFSGYKSSCYIESSHTWLQIRLCLSWLAYA